MTTNAALLREVVRLGGFATPQEALVAIRATVTTLGELLLPEDLGPVAAALPDGLAPLLRKRKLPGTFDVAEFIDRVRRRERVSLGFAREHAQVVCRALGEVLSEDACRKLDRALPDSIAALLRPPPPDAPAPGHHLGQKPGRHTLASGKPGSEHPISESHRETAHTHSVAREANPHGDSKLSSSAGMTQERLDESLATAHPNSRRTLSKASE